MTYKSNILYSPSPPGFPGGFGTIQNPPAGPVYEGLSNNYEWRTYSVGELFVKYFQGSLNSTLRSFSFVSNNPEQKPLSKNEEKLLSINDLAIDGKINLSDAETQKKIDAFSVNPVSGATDTFYAYVIVSTDGDLLRSARDKVVVKPKELVLFLEDNTGDTSPATLLSAVGSDWQERFKKVTSLNSRTEYFDDLISHSYGIDNDSLLKLIKEGEIQISGIDVADVAGKAFFVLTAIPGYIASKTLEGALGLIITGLEELKIEEKSWLPPSDGNTKFTPLFFPVSNLSALASPSAGQIAGAAANALPNATLLPLKIVSEALRIAEAECIKILSYIENNRNPTGVKFVDDFIANFLNKAAAFLKQGVQIIAVLHENVEALANVGINVVNAFLCGIVNGFIEAVNGLLTLLKWIFSADVAVKEILWDIKNKLAPTLEIIDNFLQAVSQFEFSVFFSAIKEEVIKFLKTLAAEAGLPEDEQELCKLAYLAGTIVGFIIEFVVELLVTSGTAAVLKLFESIANLGAKITEIITKLAQSILKISLEGLSRDFMNGFRTVAKFLSVKAKDFAAFVAAFLKELKAFLGLGLREETEKLFEKLGLIWQKKALPLLGSGPVLPENIYAVIREGKVIIKGSKKEIEEFAEKLAKLSEEDAVKFLDELLSLKNYDEITEFRKLKNLPEFLAAEGKTGTIAKVEIGGKNYFGINSSLSKESMALRKKWFSKITWVPPKKNIPRVISHTQSLLHAEAHSLILAFEELGQLPSRVILYVDRTTCNICMGELPMIMKAMNIEELVIYSGGKSTPVVLTLKKLK
jgi:hypothetical protein